MDTSSRRDELLRLLRRGSALSVEQLATGLGVSRRTVLRDIAALRERGFIIEGEAGRGGGVRMDPRSVLVSARFVTEEVVALVLSVAVLRAAPWIPFAGLADRALAKIEGALPADRVRELRRFMQRILIGQPGVPDAGDFSRAVDRSLLASFEQAFSKRHVLTFDYVDRFGRRSVRRVEPHAILLRAPLWYTVAWDIEKDAPRLFRMDRIGKMRADPGCHFGPRPIKYVLGVCPDAK